MEEKSISDGSVDDAVEDMCEEFTLVQSVTGKYGWGNGDLQLGFHSF